MESFTFDKSIQILALIVYILVACMNVPGCEGTLDFCVQIDCSCLLITSIANIIRLKAIEVKLLVS